MTPQRAAYAIFMLLAFTVFLAVRRALPRPAGLSEVPARKRLLITLAGFVGGTLGAKLPFLWSDPKAWLGDGKTITTALLGGYLSVELAKNALSVRVKTGDGYALPLACALAVGRWGCFFNGCCAGTETPLPWGVDFGDGIHRHPAQIYESIFHLLLAGALVIVLIRDDFRLQRLKLYLIAYGMYRFLTEWIRPEPAWWLGLTFYQWAALTIIVGLSIQWQFDRHRSNSVSEQLNARTEIAI